MVRVVVRIKLVGKSILSGYLRLFVVLYAAGTTAQIDTKWTDLNIGGATDPSLILPFFPHRANAHSNSLVDRQSVSKPEVCGACHTDIYQQWKDSMMAYSWDDPIYRALLQRASVATGGAVDNFCTGCHTPIGLTSGQINSAVNRAPLRQEDGDPLPGVDCETCHNISTRSGIDNGAYQLSVITDSRPLKYGPRSDAVSPFHDTAYSALHTRSDFCATCHNVTHPFNNVPIERTYDEWLESSYARDGVTCQDCHMKKSPGRAANEGPQRADVASHYFAGGNSTVLSHLGAENAAEEGRKMLRSAAKLTFDSLPKALAMGEINRISVKVANIGAGHKLPTGFPEGREIWIDLKITDAQGKEVFRSGSIKNGKTEKGTRNFKAKLGDKQGRVVDIEVWDVTHVISDNRILPKGYSIADFDFVVPANSATPFTVSATLNYWVFPQALVDELLGKNKMKVEVVEMGRISAVLEALQNEELKSAMTSATYIQE